MNTITPLTIIAELHAQNAQNNYEIYKENFINTTITIENETIRLMREQGFSELTLSSPVPMILSNQIANITAIRIVGDKDEYFELEFKIDLTDTFIGVDDFPQTSNNFCFPYLQILNETIQTIFPK